ncbi:MAG: HlyD family efflux transporter periplasmic adaptor subunit [Desulfobacterales bacterium]|nr:HlyD family efflux transporter periplasmic adaptor subunit [Desulfobacterales bacterium]
MDQLTQNWLHTLCNLTIGVTRGVVFLKTEEKNGYGVSAFWPNKLNEYEALSEAAKSAISGGRSVLLSNLTTKKDTGEPHDIIAAPLYIDKQPFGAVALQMYNRIPAKQQTAMQQIANAAYWYESILKQRTSTEKKQLVTIVELVASCLEHQRFDEAATDVATDLTARVLADRVSIGFLDKSSIAVEAVSHSAGFDRRSNLIRDIGEAMHEAIDQNHSICYPKLTDEVLPTHCHATLIDDHHIGNVLTVPFAANGKMLGAILFERPVERAFDDASIEHCQQIVSMIGPVLDVRRRDEQGLLQRLRQSGKQALDKSRSNIALKAGFACLIAVLGMLLFISTDYRVTGDARLEAQTQRVIVAPQNGYIAKASIRPGDIVQSGDLLGTLDVKDLNLEYRKWASQLDQLETEYRDALARHDRSSVSITQARIAQAEAQLNLVGEQLMRTQLAAPFDGLVVSGDLTQALGSPVERGQVLFTVAPLDVYRVILNIDERDVGEIKPGQRGDLILSGMPRKPLELTVEKVTPVSTAEEGRNFFQVEAKMNETSDLLRPGMEGVAKITIERRKLIWIWTHNLVDWLRLTFWSLWP